MDIYYPIGIISELEKYQPYQGIKWKETTSFDNFMKVIERFSREEFN
jgi:hypothetical protein